jgi:hypothetical protein
LVQPRSEKTGDVRDAHAKNATGLQQPVALDGEVEPALERQVFQQVLVKEGVHSGVAKRKPPFTVPRQIHRVPDEIDICPAALRRPAAPEMQLQRVAGGECRHFPALSNPHRVGEEAPDRKTEGLRENESRGPARYGISRDWFFGDASDVSQQY